MKTPAVYDRLTAILRNIFDDESLVATPELTADQVDGWDSFAHMRLILAVEKAFNVNFAASEISNLHDVGQLADIVAAKHAG